MHTDIVRECLAEPAEAGPPVSLEAADVLVLEHAALALALLLRLEPVSIALAPTVAAAMCWLDDISEQMDSVVCADT